MGRNNDRNIKIHNDKLHKAQDKAKQAERVRKEKLKEIVKQFNENKNSEEKLLKIPIMKEDNYLALKNNVQEIIDLIASKNAIEANSKLADVSEQLDDILDHSDDDDDLRELSKYQVLLNQLHQKIIALNGQAN